MARIELAGKWLQVVVGVLAWLVLVPIIEAIRATVERMTPPRRRPHGRRRGMVHSTATTGATREDPAG